MKPRPDDGYEPTEIGRPESEQVDPASNEFVDSKLCDNPEYD